MLIGLKKIAFAPLATDTDSATTYGAVTKAPEPIDVQINPGLTDPNILYAGDAEADRIYSDPEGEIVIEMKDLPLWLQRLISGHTLDANGVTVKSASDDPVYVAIGIEATTREHKSRYMWFYKCMAKPITETMHTIEGATITRQTGKISFGYMKRKSDGKWSVVAEDDVDGFNGGATFLDSVYETTPASVTMIHEVLWDLTAPAKGGTPDTTMSDTGYTGVVTWSPTPSSTFAAETVYIASVTLTAAAGYVFNPYFGPVNVDGLPAGGTVSRLDDETILITVSYPATGA